MTYAYDQDYAELGTLEWLLFERSLAKGKVPLGDDPWDREQDLLDFPDGTAMLEALVDTEPERVSGSWLVLQPNKGAGDCLFYALWGSDLERDALRQFRRQVASVRLHLPEDPRGNMLRVVAALLQTPFTRDRGLALVADGISGLRNEVCAALQAVPGLFAGESEIEQWCVLTGQRVVVVDSGGSLLTISGVGQTATHCAGPDLRQNLAKLLDEGTTVLFKTPGHWQRVRGLQIDHDHR